MQVFSCEFCKICKNTFFAEHQGTTASDYSSINSNEGKIDKETAYCGIEIKAYQSEPEKRVSYQK